MTSTRSRRSSLGSPGPDAPVTAGANHSADEAPGPIDDSRAEDTRADGSRRERVGVLGGTFDPIHVAHLAVAVAAGHQLGLDRVLLVVANVPWQKAALRRVSDADARLAMVAAACVGRPGIEASDLEIVRGGDSYTADTLAALHAPDRDLFLIIGSDLVDDLHTWKRWEEIPPLCTLAVAHRPGEQDRGDAVPSPDPRWRSVRIDVPALEISSTELRDMARAGRPIDFLVPDSVLAVIKDRDLYRDSPDSA
jgi:nicotinate-nucleotide adenylyltransferase